MALSDEKRLRRSYYRSLTGVTGTQQIPVPKSHKDLGTRLPCQKWQAQLTVAGSPTAGTLTLRGKVPGADEFAELGGTMDMTGADLVRFEGLFDEIEVVPDSFDGDSYSVYLTASVY